MAQIWKFGSDVDTDQIVPGRYAPYMRPNEDVGTAAFIEANPEFNKNAQPGDIIVADENFGCGSSREYAALALKNRAVAVIIAHSFARIFYRNAINLGIPLIESPEIADLLQNGDQCELDLSTATLVINHRILELPALSPFTQAILSRGGIIPYIQEYGHLPGENQED